MPYTPKGQGPYRGARSGNSSSIVLATIRAGVPLAVAHEQEKSPRISGISDPDCVQG